MKQTLRASALVVMATITVVGALRRPRVREDGQEGREGLDPQIDDLSGTGWSQKPHNQEKYSDLPSCRPTNKARAKAEKGGAHSPDFRTPTAPR